MGKDMYSRWYREEDDGTFTEINLGTVREDALSTRPRPERDVADPGRGAALFALFGDTYNPKGVPPLPQAKAPFAVDERGDWTRGVVTLQDLAAYDFTHPAWQAPDPYPAHPGGVVADSVRYLREVIVPLLQVHAQGRPVYGVYTIG